MPAFFLFHFEGFFSYVQDPVIICFYRFFEIEFADVNLYLLFLITSGPAQMAELVDALHSGCSPCTWVGVRVPL